MARKQRGLTVAGLRMAIEVPEALPWRWPAGPLERFASSARNPDIRVAVRIGRPQAPPSESLGYDSEGGIFDIARDGRDFVIALRIRGDLQRVARFDEGFRSGEVVIAPDSIYARDGYYPLAYPLDEVIYLHRIVREGGLLLHSCGVVRDGAGLIFTGPSGAGKTTISRLMIEHAGAGVLSDDRIVLRHTASGVSMAGTPWHGDGELSCDDVADLRALHVIRHAPDVLAEPMSGGTAAAALLSNAFLPAHDRLGAALALDFASRLVDRIPVIRLGFPKDERVVRYAFGTSTVEVRPQDPRARLPDLAAAGA